MTDILYENYREILMVIVLGFSIITIFVAGSKLFKGMVRIR